MAKITGVVTGINQVRTAFRMLDTGLQARLRGAVAETTHAVREGAASRVPVSGPGSRKAKGRPGPGELRDSIREEFSREGFTGYVKAGFGKLTRRSRAGAGTRKGQEKRNVKIAASRRARALTSHGLGKYAMVIEYGSPNKGKAAQPYMRPARHAEDANHRARVERAIAGAVTAAGGDR